ncbi:hypothetical protein KO353_11235 [Elioraea tepida]|jgi:hypothetical protein|uniref:Uncharacterized protein n=1 Tax=Elioraea tepida TaxID=2843330 RepID=A0A975U1X4_9PROT|nr:hypothetical protein [Elioraea tepida]QXM23868.1 hypothetical protein KO353_11235 [Elioraea tepida]
MGCFGILAGLALLIGLAFRGWTVLLLAPAEARPTCGSPPKPALTPR